MNRRSFITALSLIPAVALFPRLLKASPEALKMTPRVRLFLMYKAMESFGDRPDALFMSPERMREVAKMFDLKPENNPTWGGEITIPWGGDICGSVGIRGNHIEVSAGYDPRNPWAARPNPQTKTALYFFNWESDTFTRSVPPTWNADGTLRTPVESREHNLIEVVRRAEERYQEFAQVSNRILRGLG